MVLQFMLFAYTVAILILLAVFVVVATYMKTSGIWLTDDPVPPVRPWFRRSRSLLFHHRNALALGGKHPTRLV